MKEFHPIGNLILECLEPATGGENPTFRLGVKGCERVIAAVRAALQDGSIAQCCDTAVVMIGFLITKGNADQAVLALRGIATQLKPEIDEALGVSARSAHQKVEASLSRLLGEKALKKAGHIDAKNPEGTLKLTKIAPLRRVIR